MRAIADASFKAPAGVELDSAAEADASLLTAVSALLRLRRLEGDGVMDGVTDPLEVADPVLEAATACGTARSRKGLWLSEVAIGSGLFERVMLLTVMTALTGTGGGGEAIMSRLSDLDRKPFSLLALPTYIEVSEDAVMVRAFAERSELRLGLDVGEPAAAAAAIASPKPFSVPVSGLIILADVAIPRASLMLRERGALVASWTEPISGSSSFQNEPSEV